MCIGHRDEKQHGDTKQTEDRELRVSGRNGEYNSGGLWLDGVFYGSDSSEHAEDGEGFQEGYPKNWVRDDEGPKEILEEAGWKSSVKILNKEEFLLVQGAANSTARHLPGFKTEAKANGLRGDLPCAMGPLPATDRLEAKQLRMCLLSKRVVILRQKSKSGHCGETPGRQLGAGGQAT